MNGSFFEWLRGAQTDDGTDGTDETYGTPSLGAGLLTPLPKGTNGSNETYGTNGTNGTSEDACQSVGRGS